MRGAPSPCLRTSPKRADRRFVIVEDDGAALEVEISPGKRRRLTGPPSLASEEAIEATIAERDLLRSEQSTILVGVQPRRRLRGAGAWQEATRRGFD
jgi:hypothetical protein